MAGSSSWNFIANAHLPLSVMHGEENKKKITQNFIKSINQASIAPHSG